METTRNDMHTSLEEDDSSDDELLSFRQCAKFSQVWDPIGAMLWISHMEDVFKILKCAEEDKVTNVVSLLRSEALVWWDTRSGLKTPTKMTWSRFKEVFRDEFFPVSMELELMEEFKSLKQGRNESVLAYTSRFERLWWFYAHYLSYEKRVMYLFTSGLRDDIKDFMSTRVMTTYQNVVQVAKLIENLNTRRLEGGNGIMRKHRSMCGYCGKKHEGECCRYRLMGCYRCGKCGHLARLCPLD